MIRDALELERGAVVEADVCIAGAGAAGITLARDLGARGLGVCLLESGGFEPGEAEQALYAGSSVGLPYEDLNACRLRYFGGTTNHWAGECRPLDADDLAGRDWIPGSAWPVSWAELMPYYERAQRSCEIPSSDYAPAALSRELELPLLPLDATRIGNLVFRRSPPTRFGQTYRDDLAASEKIRVYLHANLVNVALDDTAGRVVGFECATLAGLRFAAHAKRYVLALGGIENARLLLASRQQRSAGLGNENDLVGRYFMEHPHYYAGAYAVLRNDVDARLYEVGRPAGAGAAPGDGHAPSAALTLSPGLQAEEKLAKSVLVFQRGSRTPEEAAGNTGELDAALVASLLRQAGPAARVHQLTIRSEQRPTASSRVRLGDSRDALDMPRIELDWRIDPADLASTVRSVRRIAAELGRAGLGRLWLPLDPAGRFEPPVLKGGCHHMGTTRMSDDPATGVVDADSCLHSCSNLWMAGSSVFPSCGISNPTLTIVALAHRLAAHLGALA